MQNDPGRVTEVSCLLDLAISLDRWSLAMGEQSLKKMGFSWASWTSRMAKSIVVRFVSNTYTQCHTDLAQTATHTHSVTQT